MRTLAILPIKSFGAAKQRLAAALGGGSRRALAQAMFSDVLSSLRRVPSLDSIAVVTADVEAKSAAWDSRILVLDDDARDGQSAATLTGIRYAIAARFDRVLLVPGDTPLVDPGEVESLLRLGAAAGIDVTIVPDRHGEGTNALLLSPPDAIDPSFGPGSLERHVEAARAGGRSHRVESPPSLLHDVDTPEDLADLRSALEELRGRAPRTRGTLTQLGRAGGRGARAPVSA